VAYYDGNGPNPLKSMQMSSMTVLIRLSGTSLCIGVRVSCLRTLKAYVMLSNFVETITLPEGLAHPHTHTHTLRVFASCHLIFKIEFKACFYLSPNGMKINVLLSKRPICCLFLLLSHLKRLKRRDKQWQCQIRCLYINKLSLSNGPCSCNSCPVSCLLG